MRIFEPLISYKKNLRLIIAATSPVSKLLYIFRRKLTWLSERYHCFVFSSCLNIFTWLHYSNRARATEKSNMYKWKERVLLPPKGHSWAVPNVWQEQTVHHNWHKIIPSVCTFKVAPFILAVVLNLAQGAYRSLHNYQGMLYCDTKTKQ